MGSFLGHALPGILLSVLASWWTLQIFRRYFLSQTNEKYGPFTSSLFFPVTIGKRSVPVDAYMLLITMCAGILGEVVATIFRHHHLEAVNIQHITMYFSIALPLLPTLVLHKSKIFPKSEEVAYLLNALSSISFGLLFKFHAQSTTGTSFLLHTLLEYLFFAAAIVFLIEMTYRENVLLPLIRTFCFFLGGTWLLQIAFVLYPPHKGLLNAIKSHENTGDHDYGMLMACSFIWHMITHVFIIMICGICVGKYYTRKYGIKQNEHFNPKYSPLLQNEIGEDNL